MLPIFFIIALFIAVGLLSFGYIEKEKAAIFIGGIILILLGVSATIDKIDFASGTNTTILTENQYQPYTYNETLTVTGQCTASCPSITEKTAYLLMNSTTTETAAETYSQTSGLVDKIFGVILVLIGLYFIIAAFTIV
jgi:putative Mn2+ efflux pump MntP